MGYYKNVLRYRKTSTSITITKYKPCDGCTEVEIPAVIEGLPVTEIDGWVFSECSHLTKKMTPVRSARYVRKDRNAVGHEIEVRYIIGVGV